MAPDAVMAFAKAWNEYNAAAESVIQKHGSRSISEIDDALHAWEAAGKKADEFREKVLKEDGPA
jgi:hypothetical protein